MLFPLNLVEVLSFPQGRKPLYNTVGCPLCPLSSGVSPLSACLPTYLPIIPVLCLYELGNPPWVGLIQRVIVRLVRMVIDLVTMR
jgi:hypothetical protein